MDTAGSMVSGSFTCTLQRDNFATYGTIDESDESNAVFLRHK